MDPVLFSPYKKTKDFMLLLLACVFPSFYLSLLLKEKKFSFCCSSKYEFYYLKSIWLHVLRASERLLFYSSLFFSLKHIFHFTFQMTSSGECFQVDYTSIEFNCFNIVFWLWVCSVTDFLKTNAMFIMIGFPTKIFISSVCRRGLADLKKHFSSWTQILKMKFVNPFLILARNKFAFVSFNNFFTFIWLN